MKSASIAAGGVRNFFVLSKKSVTPTKLRIVGATKDTPYAGWFTQRKFVLDDQKADELSALAGNYRRRRKSPDTTSP